MGISIARVDERLIHGQIITTWTKQLKISQIYIIDDKLAQDPFMSEVLVLSAPSGLNFEVLTVSQAMEKLKEDSKLNIMLLFKSIRYVYELIQAGYPLKELNLGNLGAAPNRKSISRNVSLSPEDMDIVRKIIKSDTYVYLQMLLSEDKVDVKKFI